MPVERFFYPELFEEDQLIHFKDRENHHLVTVMRMKIGEAIELINGKGQLAKAVVKEIEKKSSTLLVTLVKTDPSQRKRLILAQAIPRLNRLDYIIEKCTELGVTEIWLFPSTYSEKKNFSENQLERIDALMIAAIKQCGRLFLPKLSLLPALKQWTPFTIPTFFGDTHPDASPFILKWRQLESPNEAIFCIGPEGGFTEEEEQLLQKLGAHGVKLHHHILRTDTAAIASIALLSHLSSFKD